MKQSRVTIDLDAYVPQMELKAIRAYHTLEREADDVEVRISSGGEGIHIIGWFSERLSEGAQKTLRRMLNDDTNRTRLDTLEGWHRERAVSNVLWTEKGGDTPDMDFDSIYTALDHISATDGLAEQFERDVKAGLVV